MKRLHWGCGTITPYGWINSDIAPGPGVDVVADILSGLPLADGEFDYVVSIHALPEIAFRDQARALCELWRVLRPGGVLRLGLPDLDRAIAAYVAKDIDYFLIPDEHIQSLAGKFVAQLTWYGRSRCQFTAELMAELLARSGFVDVRPCGFRQTASAIPEIVELDDRPLESFFVEARK